MSEPLLSIRNLKKYFPVRRFLLAKDYVKAVDGVSFDIYEGEMFGVVGESGCGKTTLGRTVLLLTHPTAGEIYYRGENVLKYDNKKMIEFRRKTQIVFQDPYSSLDPRQTIFDVIIEGPRYHGIDVGDPEEFVISLLRKVGLEEYHLYRYPHEFSGGQKQRIAIARALAMNPEFVVFDEPTSALDVSVQASILNMIKQLQKELGLTGMFISHDLAVVKFMSQRIGVMYVGKIVEIGDSDELFKEQLHPYTRALFSSIPIPNPQKTRSRKKIIIRGEPPSPIHLPKGCRFYPRCPYAMPICKVEEPGLIEINANRHVACWLYR
ncbi:MAG: ABC transporter ATP-binding protein [Crenarchaeota archaeon]|nr:ABC transporter ATP-binding protein [Thermoproteota archaeon]